ncbi:MAG: ATP-binding cassette domain-containing protein [Chloroflexi bacterium]|nr:ATP-binding cassette domain-containing protein [Chloroflexota bacterium]
MTMHEQRRIGGSFVLQTLDIEKRFGGVYAVDRLSISIPRGLITAIIGPNGSGKSTLINLLSGTLPLDGGMVVVGPKRLRIIKPFDSPNIGLTRTFQDVRLFEQISVLDNLYVVMTERSSLLSLFQRARKEHRERAERILNVVGLWEKRNDLAEELSYGQRKLLEVGRLMAMNTQIYLFDEPFAGLALHMIEVVKGVMRELQEYGRTIIFVSHNMGIVRELSDYLIVMDSGRLLAHGRPDQVLNDPAVIEAYLGN